MFWYWKTYIQTNNEKTYLKLREYEHTRHWGKSQTISSPLANPEKNENKI